MRRPWFISLNYYYYYYEWIHVVPPCCSSIVVLNVGWISLSGASVAPDRRVKMSMDCFFHLAAVYTCRHLVILSPRLLINTSPRPLCRRSVLHVCIAASLKSSAVSGIGAQWIIYNQLCCNNSTQQRRPSCSRHTFMTHVLIIIIRRGTKCVTDEQTDSFFFLLVFICRRPRRHGAF